MRRALHAVTPAAGGAGLCVLVVGTFLPWLRSGDVLRNSYQTDGAIRRLMEPDGLLRTALHVWPLVSLACAAVVALFLLGLRFVAAAMAVVVALAAGGVSLAALISTGTQPIMIDSRGPLGTFVGAAVVLVAASMQLAISVRARRGRP